MSTDHQRYSIAFQTATNAAYAAERGYQIVRDYTDAGVSGLSIKGRSGLRSLLADIVSGDIGYDLLLVYDVSRWGRFQDTDEAAHYEFLCRQGGVRLEYTAESFDNDGSIASALLKHLKRAMAAEYSRDLSGRIARVKGLLAREGYWMSGLPGYGYRRQVIDLSGRPGRILEHGDEKTRSERVRLALGPDHEVATVRRIFKLFAYSGLSVRAIAALLNAEGVSAERGARWSVHRIRGLLKNEKYAGVLVLGRQVHRLKVRTRQPKTAWLRLPGAVPAIIPASLFELTARHVRTHHQGASDEELISQLRTIHARHGRLSYGLIRADPAAYSPVAFQRRFGSLSAAYALAGYEPTPHQVRAGLAAARGRPDRHRRPPREPTDDELLDHLRAVWNAHGRLTVELIDLFPTAPKAWVYRERFGGMRRAYALVGYAPSELQDRVMDHRPGQTLDRAAAAAVRLATLEVSGSAADGPEPDRPQRRVAATSTAKATSASANSASVPHPLAPASNQLPIRTQTECGESPPRGEDDDDRLMM